MGEFHGVLIRSRRLSVKLAHHLPTLIYHKSRGFKQKCPLARHLRDFSTRSWLASVSFLA
jgi:hypothetical protein